MKKLIRFYEEEMGSDGEDDYYSESGSDLSEVSESSSASGSSSYTGSSRSGSSASGASAVSS